jgi:hypothetical protein
MRDGSTRRSHILTFTFPASLQVIGATGSILSLGRVFSRPATIVNPDAVSRP